MVEAIIALPENMFYNTGIGTFIWILSNQKEEHRKGKIQLIDATAMKSPLRKNMGVVPKTLYGQRTVEATNDLDLLKLVFKGDFVISLRSFQG